ncbi:PaaI family thioesterase [Phenylobacterium sp.]|uniref:PaaI family thioesterase n=1 Tax=Phenylobacterium sp. TaxID=1871053 RepID=UPI0028115E95|nr:PaaI family thioesterase [Phenylobacterium sp.]
MKPLRKMLGRAMTLAPHARALGLKFEAMEPGRGRMSVAWRDDLVADPESLVIASGVVTALLDHCCGLAVNATGEISFPIATLDLRIDYMRPAAPKTGVTAEAHCYKLTRSIAFVRAEAWDVDRNDLVATAQAAFILNRGQG